MTNKRLSWQEKNPNLALHAKLKHRCKKLGAFIGNEDAILAWIKIWRTEAQAECFYCKIESQGKEMTVDHIVPLTKGGGHDISNLVVCCESCNHSKNDKPPEIWLARARLIGIVKEALSFLPNNNLPPPSRMSRHLEFKSCCALILWWGFYSRINKIPAQLLMHIPNGGNVGARNGANLKAMGVRAGVPDYFLAHPSNGYNGLWIEMKSETGRVSPEQKIAIEVLGKQGYLAVVVRSTDEARATIEKYLTVVEVLDIPPLKLPRITTPVQPKVACLLKSKPRPDQVIGGMACV